MADNLYNLKWNDFTENAANSFDKLRKNEELLDITLITEDRVFIKAHKVVLAASSVFFQEIVKMIPGDNSHLYLNGVNSKNLSILLDYIYCGETSASQDDLGSLLDAAKILKVEGLTEQQEVKADEPQVKKKSNETSSNLKKRRSASKAKVKSEPVEGNNLSFGHIINESITVVNDENKIYIANPEEVGAKILELSEVTEDGKFKCKVCGKESNKKINLEYHMERHFDGLAYPCQICDQVFKTRQQLSDHKSKTHKNQ